VLTLSLNAQRDYTHLTSVAEKRVILLSF